MTKFHICIVFFFLLFFLPLYSSASTFPRDLQLGSVGDDVQELQQYLNSHGFTVSQDGLGSPSQETKKFGQATFLALQKFQKSVGIKSTGYFGPLTRSYISSASTSITDTTSSSSVKPESVSQTNFNLLKQQLFDEFRTMLSRQGEANVNVLSKSVEALSASTSNVISGITSSQWTTGSDGTLSYVGGNVEIGSTLIADGSSLVNVKAYGAKGNGVTDDTAAINAAIAAANSSSQVKCVLFPAGTYKVTSTIQISHRNQCFQGEGHAQSIIDSSISGPIFNLGSFNLASNPYVDIAQGAHFTQLVIQNSSALNIANTGSRATIGIQDNGNGEVYLTDVWFYGLQYGFAAPYGSDFDRFYRVTGTNNDVGIFLGYASQQFSLHSLSFSLNGEGVVIDGAFQGEVRDSAFGDNKTSDLTFEYNIPNRMGYTGVGVGADHSDTSIVVANTWFETGSGWTLPWQEYQRILIQSNTDVTYPRHLIFRDLGFVLGDTGLPTKDGTPHSILKMTSGKYISLENVNVEGNRYDSVVYATGGGGRVAVTNYSVIDGYTRMPVFSLNGPPTYGGYFYYQGKIPKESTPSVSACGTGPTTWGTSNDEHGRIDVGAGASSCTVTFTNPAVWIRSCVVTSRSGLPLTYSLSTTTLVVSNASLAGTVFDYFCSGQ